MKRIDFYSMSCTKLRDFFENKRVAWVKDNMELSDLMLVRKRIYECSPKVYATMKNFFGLAEQQILRR